MEGCIYPKQWSAPSSPLSYLQRLPSTTGCCVTSGARLRSPKRTAKPPPHRPSQQTCRLLSSRRKGAARRGRTAVANTAGLQPLSPAAGSTHVLQHPPPPPRGSNVLPRRPQRLPTGAVEPRCLQPPQPSRTPPPPARALLSLPRAAVPAGSREGKRGGGARSLAPSLPPVRGSGAAAEASRPARDAPANATRPRGGAQRADRAGAPAAPPLASREAVEGPAGRAPHPIRPRGGASPPGAGTAWARHQWEVGGRGGTGRLASRRARARGGAVGRAGAGLAVMADDGDGKLRTEGSSDGGLGGAGEPPAGAAAAVVGGGEMLLNVGLLALALLAAYRLYLRWGTRSGPGGAARQNQAAALPRMKRRDFSLEQLREFDGARNPRILLAVNGKVFDVTKGSKFYGPGEGTGMGTERAGGGPSEKAALPAVPGGGPAPPLGCRSGGAAGRRGRCWGGGGRDG